MEDLKDEIKEYQREAFDRWSCAKLEDIKSNKLSMQTNTQMVYFEVGKDMKVSCLFYGWSVNQQLYPGLNCKKV